jgi:hypothetical protein
MNSTWKRLSAAFKSVAIDFVIKPSSWAAR